MNCDIPQNTSISLFATHVDVTPTATGLSSKFSLARVPSVSLSDGATEPAQIDNETLSMEELMTSPLYSHWSPAGSESDSLGLRGAPSETAVDGAHRGFLVRRPSREERVTRTAETPERDTSPSVSPQTSFTGVVSDVTVFYRDSSVGELHLSPSVGEELVVEAYEVPSPEKETPSASVGGPSSVVSARYTGSGLTRRAFSEKEVTRPETPDRHTSPRLSARVSPQSSLTRISSAPSMEEPQMSPTASVGRLSPAVSSVRYYGRGLSGRAFSETELVDAAHSAPSVRIPSREESVRRRAETPERDTSPRVFPRSSQRVSPQTSLLSGTIVIHTLQKGLLIRYYKIVGGRASRVAQWLRVRYCSASCATRDSGFAPRL